MQKKDQPEKFCRACKRPATEIKKTGDTLFTVAVRWAYGLPPYMCSGCCGHTGHDAEDFGADQ